MPEGPEVKLYVDKLNKLYSNETIESVNILSGRYLKKPIDNLSSLSGQKVLSVNCKGKFIWFELQRNIIFNTLGMTGSWSRVNKTHSRIKITFSNGDHVYFNDIRNFGTFHVKTREELVKKLKSIGPDMLSNPPHNFIQIMRKRDNKNICEVLMKQNIISGVGNYIKAESLWLAKINPHATISNLSDKDLMRLELAILQVIKESYKSQGASLKTYTNFDNEEGEATDFFNVYSKKLDVLGNKVIKEETPDKRTTHWSPARQVFGIVN